MSPVLVFLLSYLLLYKYAAIFVVLFFSAVILPLPDNTMLLAAGAFASQGYFDFAAALGVSVGASMAGDLFDYVLASLYGQRALKMLHVRTPSYIQLLEVYVRKHPGLTIFVTRFVGTIDSLASLLSGFVGVPLLTFLVWDFLGNFISIGAVMWLGYLVGASWMAFSGIVGIIGWILLVLFLISSTVLIWGDKIGIRIPKRMWRFLESLAGDER